ncbi:MAG: NADAR family protein [Bacteroidota bacterium]
MKYSRKQLIADVENGKKLKYLFFWGHKASLDGSLRETCFSQWWAGYPFDEDGISYSTAEHYMMAGKARLFKDEEMLGAIIKAGHPDEAKKFGRQVRGFVQEEWEAKRTDIVTHGNYLKFSQHPELKAFLLRTGQRVIVEASPYDHIWGIGMESKHQHAAQPINWKGANLLGFCLMEVRDRLMKGETV